MGFSGRDAGEDHIFNETTIIPTLPYKKHHPNDWIGKFSQCVALPYLDLESRAGTEGRTKRMGNKGGRNICLAIDVVLYPVLRLIYPTGPQHAEDATPRPLNRITLHEPLSRYHSSQTAFPFSRNCLPFNAPPSFNCEQALHQHHEKSVWEAMK